MYLVILLYAILALTFTLGKLSVLYAQFLFVITTRMIIGGSLLLLIYFLQKRTLRSLSWSREDLKNFGLVTLFHIYLSFVPEFWALQYVPSVKVNIMYATTPFMTLIFSYLLYGERITRLQFFGSLLGFMGLLPLLIRGEEVCLNNIASLSAPELMLFVSIASGAYAWFIIKRLMDRGYSLLVINGISMVIGGVLSGITWYFTSTNLCEPVYETVPFLLTLAALIITSNIIVYNLYGWLLNYYTVNFVSCVGFICPVFGALYGRLFLGESLGWQHVFAITGIAIGLYLFFHGEIKAKRSKPQQKTPPPTFIEQAP